MGTMPDVEVEANDGWSISPELISKALKSGVYVIDGQKTAVE